MVLQAWERPNCFVGEFSNSKNSKNLDTYQKNIGTIITIVLAILDKAYLQPIFASEIQVRFKIFYEIQPSNSTIIRTYNDADTKRC